MFAVVYLMCLLATFLTGVAFVILCDTRQAMKRKQDALERARNGRQ